jgi:hypothetical protein
VSCFLYHLSLRNDSQISEDELFEIESNSLVSPLLFELSIKFFSCMSSAHIFICIISDEVAYVIQFFQ